LFGAPGNQRLGDGVKKQPRYMKAAVPPAPHAENG